MLTLNGLKGTLVEPKLAESDGRVTALDDTTLAGKANKVDNAVEIVNGELDDNTVRKVAIDDCGKVKRVAEALPSVYEDEVPVDAPDEMLVLMSDGDVGDSTLGEIDIVMEEMMLGWGSEVVVEAQDDPVFATDVPLGVAAEDVPSTNEALVVAENATVGVDRLPNIDWETPSVVVAVEGMTELLVGEEGLKDCDRVAEVPTRSLVVVVV